MITYTPNFYNCEKRLKHLFVFLPEMLAKVLNIGYYYISWTLRTDQDFNANQTITVFYYDLFYSSNTEYMEVHDG